MLRALVASAGFLALLVAFVTAHPHAGEEGEPAPSPDICTDPKTKDIIYEKVESDGSDPLATAKAIQKAATEQSGGKWEVIVSECDFAYANWYQKKLCKVKVDGPEATLYVLAWKD